MKNVDPFIGVDSFKMAPNAFRLLNFNRPPSVAFSMVSAAVELSDTMGFVKDFMVVYRL